MTDERAIEILDPEHREHYESIEPVNEACRIGMEAIRKVKELKAENAALRERLEKAVELPTERKVDDFYMEPYFGEIKMPLYDDDKAKVVIPMYVYFKFNSIGEAKQWLKEQQEK